MKAKVVYLAVAIVLVFSLAAAVGVSTAWADDGDSDQEIFFYNGTSTIQLTDNSYHDYRPQIDGGQVTWYGGEDCGGHEIFLYDGTSTIQLTDNDYDDGFPQIDSGQVTWAGLEGGWDWEIFLYDGTSTTRLTDNSYGDHSPQIDNGQVTWFGNVDGAEIFLYDIASATTTRLTDTPYGNYGPQIDGGQVAWYGSDGNDFEIFLYDIASATTTRLTDNSYGDFYPQIDSEQVTWTGYEGGDDPEIFLYDIASATTTRLTDNSYDDLGPQIDSGQVAWSGYEGGDDPEIFLYDIASATSIRLTDNSYDDHGPQIHSGQVAWYGYEGGDDAEIFLYDIASATTTRLTDNSYIDSFAQIDNGQVVWQGAQPWGIYGDFDWYKIFGNPGDEGHSVQQTSDGGYIIVGQRDIDGNSHWDLCLTKTDTNGNEQWNKLFGDGGPDFGYSIRQTFDGGYIITGRKWDYPSGDNRYDLWLIKTDSSGNEQWDKTFGGPGDQSGQCVQLTTDGGYIIAGYIGYGGGGKDSWLIKTDANGNEQWNKTFGSPDQFQYVQQTTDGGYIMVGGSWLIKTDSGGNEHWRKAIDGGGYSVHQTSDGGYVIAAGFSMTVGSQSYTDALLIKADSNGNESWRKAFGGACNDGATYAQQTSDGGYILIANTQSYGVGSNDGWLIKTDANGNEQWQKTFGGWGSDTCNHGQVTSAGGYIVTGTSGTLGYKAWLVKISQPAITPTPTPPAPSCFIATAAYGTSSVTELDTLRAFRDEVLLESTLGSQLVEWYYQASPPVADFISEHDVLRTLVRELLVEPVSWVVEATEAIWGD